MRQYALICEGIALLLQAVLASSGAVAQSGWQATLFLQAFPSPYFSDWESNPTIGSLTVTNNTSTQGDVLISLTISRGASGVIATGKSKPLTVPPGVPTQVNSDRFIDWNTVSYETSLRDQAIQTGRLPEGEYSACVTLKSTAGAVLTSDVCAPFTIVYPSPPSLVSPADGDSLNTPYPLFTWTPVQTPPAYQLHYVLRIAEVLPGQSPLQALSANIVQYVNQDLIAPNVQYPVDALPLEGGKTYAWQVQGVDQNGFPPSGNQGKSEIRTFSTISPQVVTPATGPASIELQIVPGGTAAGILADFGSSPFDTVAQRFATLKADGGTAQLPFPSTASFAPISIHLKRRDIFIDTHKKSIAIRGGWKKDNASYETLLTAGWGSGHDPREVCWTIKGPMLSRVFPDVFGGLTEEFLLFSAAEFTLKVSDLPDSVADFFGHIFIDSTKSDTVRTEEVELKPGINFLGKSDLRFVPGPVMNALGLNIPYVILTGFISPELDMVLSASDHVQWEAAWQGVLSAGVHLTSTKTNWMPEANLMLALGYEESRKDTLFTRKAERTLSVKASISAKLAPSFLDHTILVTGSIGPKHTLGEEGVEWVGELKANDVFQFHRFENVFKFHDPKITWNITKGKVQLEGEFDFGNYQRVGTFEMEFGRKDSTSHPDSLAGFHPSTNPTTGSPGSSTYTNSAPALPPKTNLAAMMNKEQPEPLTGAKPTKRLEWAISVKFRASALLALTPVNIIRTALNLKEDLFGDAGSREESPRALRNSAPAPAYPPPEIPDFLSRLPAFEELSISFRPDDPGSVVVRGKTTYGNSSTDIIAARVSSPTTKGFILGLKPQDWSIKNYYPDFSIPGLDNATLSNVALVFSNIAGTMPSANLSEEELTFYSAAYGSTDFTLVINKGLNLIATVPSQGLLTDGPIVALMTRLGVQQGNLLLQGALGNRIKDLYLLAFFPSMHPEGSPKWFNDGELAVEFTGLPSIGVVGALSLNINGENRNFFVKTEAGREGLLLTGGMIADSGWESPFGIQGLTLYKVVVLLGLTPGGSVQLGFSASMAVGTRDVDVAVLVALNAFTGVPTNFMFDGESQDGFGVSDLVALQEKLTAARSVASPQIPLDRVPPLYIKDAELKFAPKDSPELGITRGMTVAGVLELKQATGSITKELASTLVNVGDDGLIARGDIGAFSFGPVKLQKAALDLTLTRNEQYFRLNGRADLGFMNSDIAMSITRTSASFHTETKIFNAFDARLDADATLDLRHPVFSVKATMENDFNGVLAKNLRQAVTELVSRECATAKTAADEASRKWQDAVHTREAAREYWTSLPLLPRKQKVEARNAWERAVADAMKLGIAKDLQDGKARRWNLVRNLFQQIEQRGGSGNLVVIRNADFEADLSNLRTGAVKKMTVDASVGNRDLTLELGGWNFKDMGKSIKDLSQHVADKLFASFK